MYNVKVYSPKYKYTSLFKNNRLFLLANQITWIYLNLVCVFFWTLFQPLVHISLPQSNVKIIQN